MKQGELVFQELIVRREAIHSLLVNAERLAVQLRGLATDNQAQIGDALKQLDTALTFLRGREKQIDETLTNLGPYASILINIIGTGPWFDAFVPNLASIATGEFKQGKRPNPMNRLLRQTSPPRVAVLLLVATFVTLQRQGDDTRHVTAYFDRTVSLYKGSEVRVMGVNIGTVTAVVPEGDRVRVAMEYDDEYKLPADAKAAIVTPTLTADRFVQIAPAYTGGEVMADNAKIDLPETGTPVELDRIYKSLSDLTQALGPNGANKDGSLNTLLTAGAKALRGNGKLGNETLLNLSQAVQTFGDSSGPLFDSVENMSQLTDTLAANDRFVDGFMSDLTSVSTQLAADRGNLGEGARRPGARGRDGPHLRPRQQGHGGEGRQQADQAPRRAGPPQGRPEHAGPDRCPGPGQPDDRLRQQDQVHRLPASRPPPTAPTSATCSATSSTTPDVPGDEASSTCELLKTIVAAVHGPDRRRPVPEPEPAGPAEARRLGAHHVAGRPAELAEGGEQAMSRSLRIRARDAPSPRWCSCWSPPWSRPAASSTAPTTCPCPGNKVDADDAFEVTADFADALNVVPRTAVFANDVPVGQVTEVERVGWHARVKFLVRKDIELPQNIEIDVRQTSLLGEKYLALVEPARRYGERRSGSPTATSSRSRAPAATRRSRRSSAPCRCCLAGGGVGQLKTISHELNAMMNGRRTRRATCWATSTA